jgi:hypothetical protein
MSSSDIKMKRITATGALSIGRARLRQVQVTTTGAARLTITDGSGGAVLLDLDFVTSITHIADIPDLGILSVNDPVVSTLTNISAATIYYA